ncbi:MAG: GDP-perosamine synthase [Acinetobacter bereziniae]|uniref:GDP-perosamine synthase n=1 Tax=Acinetobacter bereziniae TaxID=106648 RepID=A0A833PH70_ACIBZ|nr:MAG: GDP-perosamine synthase [Acinetobacter bereziniae]
MKKEIPPTNGLTVEFSDLLSFNSSMDLATRLSQLLNIPKPALTCSGTVALIVALQTLRKKQPNRQQVIIPAWTCPLVALAIEKIGLIPVLCDVEQGNLNLNLCQLQRLTNTNTLAIVVTHFAGLAYDFSLVQEIAQYYQTFIIEDAAQSMGATISQQSVGLIGDIAFFSMAFGKGLSSAEGGVLFSRHIDLHQDLLNNVQTLPVLRYWEIKRCLELIAYSFFISPLY